MSSRLRYNPPPRPRRDRSRRRSRNRHAECAVDTCKAVEERYGAFGWTEGLTLALMGAVALFNFDKAYEKHLKRSEEGRSRTWAAGDEGDGGRSRRGSYGDERHRRYHDERCREGRRTSSSRDWGSRSGSW